jgi:hypothetical protein
MLIVSSNSELCAVNADSELCAVNADSELCALELCAVSNGSVIT